MKNRFAVVINYLQLLGTFMIYSFAGIFAKIAANQDTVINTVLFIFIEFCLFGVYAIIWQQVLKKFQLTIAMSCKGVTLLYALFWSVFFFHETLTIWNIVGVVLVIIGIIVVARDD